MRKLVECVPNFSEGSDMNIINQITAEISAIDGVSLVDVDPGKATNRTVVTMVGTPDEVIEAAFNSIKKASELIDMTKHHGAHPRFGATDVCPFVPVSNMTMEEAIECAHKLAERVGRELNIPVFCYENAARKENRHNLAVCRSGEYEALGERLISEEWAPDFGPAEWSDWTKKTGATAIGARNFLVAYNVNLNSTSTRRANAIAFDVRERGRNVKNAAGEKVNQPGSLKSVKAIGWFIEEFGVAQISMNLTDISVCSMHEAFYEVLEKAYARGIRVTGSELVGVLPLNAMLDAGRFFLRKQKRSTGVSDKELIKIAVKSLGLDELYPFEPNKKIIEYILDEEANKGKKKLVDMSLVAFADETASESPAPGGGSIAAYMGAMGSALGTMVANLSSHKAGWDARWEEFSDWAEKGKAYQDQLIKMVDDDTNAFNVIMAAFGLPKKTDADKATRKQAIEDATKFATEVPFKTMELCYGCMEVSKAMAEIGNPNSVTDAGVGALAARSGVLGAYLNVKINAIGLEDKAWAKTKIDAAMVIVEKAKAMEAEILAIVESKM